MSGEIHIRFRQSRVRNWIIERTNIIIHTERFMSSSIQITPVDYNRPLVRVISSANPQLLDIPLACYDRE